MKVLVVKQIEWPEPNGFNNLKLFAKYVEEEIENKLTLVFPAFIDCGNPFEVLRKYVAGKISEDEYVNYAKELSGYSFLDYKSNDALWVRLGQCIVPFFDDEPALTRYIDHLLRTLVSLKLISDYTFEGVLTWSDT